jgi:hypothetical protein
MAKKATGKKVAIKPATAKKVVAKVAKVVVKKPSVSVEKLKRFNIFMGFLHLVQGLAMIFFATTIIPDISAFQIKVTTNYLKYDEVEMALVLVNDFLFDLPFGIMVASFLLISAVAHFLISGPFNKQYNADLLRGVNKYRWFEYALSSSVMIVLISTLFGIRDIASLSLIFIVNASMNLFGLDMELLNSYRREKGEKVDWGPFIWGTIAGLAPWVAILLYMFGDTANFEQIPWFVWAIVGFYFVAFNTFPVNMILQYLKVGKWKNYLYGERGYVVLSLVAKSVLAWLVLFGSFQPG